jgi:hypothetical protein
MDAAIETRSQEPAALGYRRSRHLRSGLRLKRFPLVLPLGTVFVAVRVARLTSWRTRLRSSWRRLHRALRTRPRRSSRRLVDREESVVFGVISSNLGLLGVDLLLLGINVPTLFFDVRSHCFCRSFHDEEMWASLALAVSPSLSACACAFVRASSADRSTSDFALVRTPGGCAVLVLERVCEGPFGSRIGGLVRRPVRPLQLEGEHHL